MYFASGLLVCAIFLHSASSSPLNKRDANFYDVRTKLQVSTNNLDTNHPNKYFHECQFHRHYDGRFAAAPLAYEQRQTSLRSLVQTYLATMNDIGVETFLMHGTLLGWWWNQKIMPWDSDIDVMVSEKSIHHLASYYNMTVHHLRVSDSETKRGYLLEINPHFSNYEIDPDNKIDARWIDMDSGLFIDITTIRRNRTADALGVDAPLIVKDEHQYRYDDIFPLQNSEFEGSPAKIPAAYREILVEEYGHKALSEVYFEGHRFHPDVKQWIPLTCLDYGSCKYFRNDVDGITLPAKSNRPISSQNHAQSVRKPKVFGPKRLPYTPGAKPLPPQLLTRRPIKNNRWVD